MAKIIRCTGAPVLDILKILSDLGLESGLGIAVEFSAEDLKRFFELAPLRCSPHPVQSNLGALDLRVRSVALELVKKLQEVFCEPLTPG